MALSKIDIENMITGEVNVANGGTGLSSGTSGQFLKFTGSTTLASAADSGKVLQVVQATFSTSVDLTGTSFTNITSGGSTLEAAITPASTSNKVFVEYTIQASMDNNRGYKSQIVRAISGGASTNIFTQNDQKATYGDGDNHRQMSTMQFLDSPNTTSACTYTIQVGMDGANAVTFCSTTNTPCVITLMEIAG